MAIICIYHRHLARGLHHVSVLKKCRLSVVLLLSLVFSQGLRAENTLLLKAGQDEYYLGHHIDYLEDKQQHWSLADVTSEPLARQFISSQWLVPNFGFTDSVYWLRLKLKNQDNASQIWRLISENNSLNYVEFYRAEKGVYRSVKTGNLRPRSSRDVESTKLVFHVKLAPSEEIQTLYIRVNSQSALLLPLKLYAIDLYYQHRREQILLLSAFYGALFIALLYNLILFYHLRDINYFYYSVFIIFNALAFLEYDGLLKYYITSLASMVGFSLQAWIIAFCVSLQLSSNLLRLREFAKPMYVANRLILLLGLILLVAGFIVQPRSLLAISHISLIVAMLIMLGSGAYRSFQGYQPARVYTLSWLAFIVGSIIFSLSRFAAFDWGEYGIMALRVGIVCNAILLSLTLASTLADIRAQIARTHQKTINTNRARTRALKQATSELEQLVIARTQDLELAKNRAEDASRHKSQFLSSMSHDIRSPLTLVLGFSELIKMQERALNAQGKYALDAIMNAGHHLSVLISDILNVSQIESGEVSLQFVPVNIAAILIDMRQMFSMPATEKNIELTFTLSDDFPTSLMIDEGKFRQILINLLGNAIKFTERGQISCRASCQHSHDGNIQLLIEVQDSGPGIAAEELDKVFASYAQTASGKKYESTGLGLVISRQYARLMGGDIDLHSDLGQGSTFYFALQARASNSVDETSVDAGDAAADVISLGRNKADIALLIVDDDKSQRLLLRRILEPVGFVIHEADSGENAICVFLSVKPMLVLMDWQLVDMSGLEAKGLIRATKSGRHTPVILLTASVFSDDDNGLIALAKDEVLYKPYSQRSLIQLIGSQLSLNYHYASPANNDKKHQGTLVNPSGNTSPSPAKILVVDDVEVNRILLKSILSSLGFDCRLADSGAVALDIIVQWQPELVLLDIQMPDMDGFQVLQQLKRHEWQKNTRIVAVSADLTEHDLSRLHHLGVTTTCEKPVRVEKIRALLEQEIH